MIRFPLHLLVLLAIAALILVAVGGPMPVIEALRQGISGIRLPF